MNAGKAELYGVWWIIVEKINYNLNENGNVFSIFSHDLAKSCGFSVKKLATSIQKLSDIGIIQFQLKDGEYFLTSSYAESLADDYSRTKKRKSRTLLKTVSENVVLDIEQNRTEKRREDKTRTDSKKPNASVEICNFVSEFLTNNGFKMIDPMKSYREGKVQKLVDAQIPLEDIKTIYQALVDSKLTDYHKNRLTGAYWAGCVADHYDELLKSAKGLQTPEDASAELIAKSFQ